MARLAFILSQFPEMHETFILREFEEFRRRGVDFLIYSLKPCRDAIIHPGAEPFLPDVRYSPFLLSWRVMAAQLGFLGRRPLAYARAVGMLVRTGWRDPLTLLKTLAVFPKTVRFAADMEREGITHIHAHWATVPTSSALALSRLIGRRFSFTAHAWDIYVKNPSLPAKLAEAAFVVTCTGHNKEYLESLAVAKGSAEVMLNYHGIDLARFAPGNPNVHSRDRILAIGRLVEQKGYPYLLRAIRRVLDDGHPVTCTIVGTGPDREALRSLIRELDLDELVELAGPMPQEEIRALYRAARAFVLPCVIARNNDRDGIPNVIIEAMAMGLPVVSSEVSGIPELIVHEETGLLAAERDVEGIAANIVRILSDDALWHYVRERGRRRVEEMFDLRRNVGELIEIFGTHEALLVTNDSGELS